MDGPRHLQTREEFTENEKRGNHLRPQSTAEKNLNSAAVLLITRLYKHFKYHTSKISTSMQNI